MRLWIDGALQSSGQWPQDLISSAAQGQVEPRHVTPGGLVGTLRTEEQFIGLIVCGSPDGEIVSRARDAAFELAGGAPHEIVVEGLLSALRDEKQLPLALLHVRSDDRHGKILRARLIECDAPPLFMARQGGVVLLPVIEEELGSHLIRRCEFELRDGDHLAMVSEGFVQGVRWDGRWAWRDIAAATRRLTETRCSAEQLASALIRQYRRLAGSEPGSRESADRNTQAAKASPVSGTQHPVSVLAMFVRPMRTLTIWSGPPADRAAEKPMLDALMREEDLRVVCGDTTAEIAARLLGAALVMEPRPEEGWTEVPPVSRLVLPDGKEAVTLVTEGVVTMRMVRQRLAEAAPQNGIGTVQARDLAGRADGASRLAALLLTADKVKFLVGTAVNPAQVAADGTPLRRTAVTDLLADLKERGKIVSLEYI
jgi:hypothetical protein